MASLGNALVTKILGHTAAEKAFRPWWDNLEDFLVYGLVMLGLVVAPTALINGTPLDCNFCSHDICDPYFEANNITNENPEDPKYSLWWVKKYCTMTAVDGFILYFPYILLIMALVIVLIERVFLRIFKAGLKLDTFYSLIAKENSTEDAADGGNVTVMDNDLENSKTALEVLHGFADNSNFFMCYLVRTCIETVIAIGLLFWLSFYGFPSIQKDEFIFCEVHKHYYECAGHPQQFYMYVLFITVGILCLYLFCCFYNLLWLIFPQLGTLSRVMRKYRQNLRDQNKTELVSDKELLGDLYWIYYKNQDLKLLLDLLATSSGVSQSIRVMTLFDADLRIKSMASNLEAKRTDEKKDVEIEFGDAFAIKNIFSNIHEVSCIYTVEIFPPTTDSCVQALKFTKNSENHSKNEEMGDVELEPLNNCKDNCQKTCFSELCPDVEYTIRVSTMLNGKPIARKIVKV